MIVTPLARYLGHNNTMRATGRIFYADNQGKQQNSQTNGLTFVKWPGTFSGLSNVR